MAIFSASKSAGKFTCSTGVGLILNAANVVVGNRTYRFRITTSVAYDIFLATSGTTASTTAALASLIAAVNGTGTVAVSGADCFTGTLKHQYVKAEATTDGVLFTSLVPGTIGNLITFTTTVTTGACDAAVLGTATAATGSMSNDIYTWIDKMQENVQSNAQALTELATLDSELR